MQTTLRWVWILVCVVTASTSRAQQVPLSIVNAQPAGEIAALAQAAEIRVRFSEAMVPIGRIPDEVIAPFFSIRPAVAGSFRWAGPTILVFTPEAKTPLPNATRYDVTIDASTTAVSGRKLSLGYTFTFTTPTVRLLQTQWYRVNGRYDQPAILALRFNQAVRPADVLAHAAARYERHEWERPGLTATERARMGAADAARFDAKVAVTAAVASSQAPIPLLLAADWDRRRFVPAPDLVVLQTVSAPATDGWLRLALDTRLPAVEGRATPPAEQSHVVYLDRTFFVHGFYCHNECDADGYNTSRLATEVRLDALRRAATVPDITKRVQESAVRPLATPRETFRSRQETVRSFTFEDLGFDRQAPARTWAVTIDGGLSAIDGQTLGYAWTGVVENWHDRAFASFGDGHGVWETGGGPLPFHARNFTDVRQWTQALTPDQLMPTIRQLIDLRFRASPPGAGTPRPLGIAADRIQSHGLNLASVLKPSGTGLVWAAVQPGQPIARAHAYGEETMPVASVVQVTNLGITVKDSPQNTLAFATRLDTGAPVGGADVSIIRLDNSVAWSGRTNDQGVALAPALRLRDDRQWWKFAFIVTAEKDGDVGYVGSDWNEGVQPFAFGARYDLNESRPLLRGTVFSDRGVYKLGEEVHFKAILRRDAPAGIQLIASGSPLYIAVRDSRDKIIEQRTVTMTPWSSTEWVTRLPADGALGGYQVAVSLDKQALEPQTARPEDADDREYEPPSTKIVRGSFLVAAYRRPEFRVDASLAGDSALAGSTLKGLVSARYLFGAAMGNRPVAWTYSRSPVFQAPIAVVSKFPGDRFAFVGCCEDGYRNESGQIASQTATLDARGQLALDLDTRPSDGVPYRYTFE